MNNIERANHWQELIDRWHASGLSGAQFCKQHECNLAQFYYWKSKHSTNPVTASKLPRQSAGFASVVVTDSPVIEEGLRFSLPNGCAIEGITQSNVGLLSPILAQL